MSKPTITVSIIGHNEATDLERCFHSIDWADEIIYVDCESEDNSIEIAKKFTDKVFERKNDLNLNVNKNFGFSKANSDWILYVDPDEEIPKEMSDWILKEMENPEQAFPRLLSLEAILKNVHCIFFPSKNIHLPNRCNPFLQEYKCRWFPNLV